jgi:hypothetical protein
VAKKKAPKKEKAKNPKKSAHAQAAQPEGRLVEIEVKLPLTDKAKVERGQIACEKLKERDSLIIERKSVANEYKARIDALTSEATKLLLEFQEGREVRPVRAREVKNHARGMMEFYYKGEKVFERPLVLAEKQQPDLPISGGAPPEAMIPKVPGVDASPALVEEDDEEESDVRPPELKHTIDPPRKRALKSVPAPTHDPVADAHAADAQAKREDVASVIKDETSVRNKWSSVDGARE